jgi:hypothetical protein
MLFKLLRSVKLTNQTARIATLYPRSKLTLPSSRFQHTLAKQNKSDNLHESESSSIKPESSNGNRERFYENFIANGQANLLMVFSSRVDQVNARIDGLSREINNLNSTMSAKFEANTKDMNARFDAVNARFDANAKEMNARFDAVNARFDAVNARFDAMNTKMDKQSEKIGKKFDLSVTVLGVMIAGLGFMYQFQSSKEKAVNAPMQAPQNPPQTTPNPPLPILNAAKSSSPA